VLHQGAIVERGSHHELIRLSGQYARLVGQQLDRAAENMLTEDGTGDDDDAAEGTVPTRSRM
jgi:hypothetical protein